MSRAVFCSGSRGDRPSGGAFDAWVRPDLLATRLAALAASEAEMREMVGELGVCPYRGGYLGASAPVLPSPDELVYVAKVLGRGAACVEHALGVVAAGETEAVCA